ncbi:MAG TPA: hypothetical protein VM242_10850 [Acidimicrobiales bacterium]|nr:hypothetical protein [Acidimicrobiales bacterium]
MVRLLIALVMFVVILRTGVAVLRFLGRPAPAPPPPGELRRVSLRYRCTSCGMELKMTAAPDEDPPPPRHCMEEMVPVAPAYE